MEIHDPTKARLLHDGQARVLVPMTVRQLKDAARNATCFEDQEHFLKALGLIDPLEEEWMRVDLAG